MIKNNSILTDQRLDEDFKKNGYVIVGQLPEENLDRLNTIFKEDRNLHCEGFSTTFLSSDLDTFRMVSKAIHIELQPVLKDLLIEYRPIFYCYTNKGPMGEKKTGLLPMHQDISFTSETGRPSIGLWIPLVDVDDDNGSLRIIPKTHKLSRAIRGPGTPFAGSKISHKILELSSVAIMEKAGSIVLMDQAVYHGSLYNKGQNMRPVAVSTLLPNEQKLAYYHRVKGVDKNLLEEYMVDDDYFFQNRIGSRPKGQKPIRIFEEEVTYVTGKVLEKL